MLNRRHLAAEASARSLRLSGAAALMFLMTACGGGGDSSPTANPPVIATQPGGQSALTDATATFSVAATGPALTYQWRKNGTAIAGATSATYTTPPVSWLDSGAQYTVVVSNSDGAVTSSAGALTLTASADQQVFEGLILSGGGSHEIRWNLAFAGPEISGTNYAFSDFSVQTQSPLTHGPQTVMQSPPVNVALSLAPINGGPARVLKNGVILVVPVQSSSTATYVGSSVKVDFLAADGVTVAYSQLRSGYASVALSGNVKATTGDFAQWHNSFFSNAAILKGTTTWAAGARYITYTSASAGDRYSVGDCVGTTTGATPSPCLTGTTLAAALVAGMPSTSDGTTYHTADGTTSTIGGVPVFVATAPRPVSATLSLTPQYRTYFELNGNIYTGSVMKDGAVIGGSYWVSNPAGTTVTDRLTFLPFQIRMNQAARDSLVADMAI
jgi:hypothetical protein